MDIELERLEKELRGIYKNITFFEGSDNFKQIREIRANFEKEAADATLEVQKRYMQIEIDYLKAFLNHGNK